MTLGILPAMTPKGPPPALKLDYDVVPVLCAIIQAAIAFAVVGTLR